ncbi:hypothetical protein Tco_1236519 [Tanacetum coccineum]
MTLVKLMVLHTGGLKERNSTSTNTVPSDHHIVRSHMRILSVISIKTYERYGYNYLREIVLRRADYNEYKISKKDFKNLHPNDFENLNILHLQGKLDHLPKQDKVHLYNAINLWTRNIVIRKRMKDLQLGIESYQTKLNLEQPNWNASGYLFKEDYTIVYQPRAVIYRDRNDQKKMMRLSEVHKFSDGTLMRIRDKLAFMVKDFRTSEWYKGTYNADGNPARANIKQALGSYERSHKGVKASANSDIIHFFTSAQDGNKLQDNERLCLADDHKKAQDHNKKQVQLNKLNYYQKISTKKYKTSNKESKFYELKTEISDIKDSRSASGYVFTLQGATISWKSSKQTIIAKSMMESEFIALDKCREKAEWLHQFVEDIQR